MTITNHAIERFKERITDESAEFIRTFIESNVNASNHLFSVNGIEKREYQGIIYIIDSTNARNPIIRTVYLAN